MILFMQEYYVLIGPIELSLILIILNNMKKKLKDSIRDDASIAIDDVPSGMMFLDMLIEKGKVPKAVVIANTEKKEELYNIDNEEKREEYLKNLPFGD